MNRYLFAACVVLFASTISAMDARTTQEIDTDYASPAATDSVFATDLDFDPAFGGTGYQIYDFNDADGHNFDLGMRTFLQAEGSLGTRYYYTIGSHFNGTNFDLLIVKTDAAGVPVTGWGNAGKRVVSNAMSIIQDVAIDRAAGRLYFVGGQRLFSTTSQEFAVSCLDIATAAPCAGFGNVGQGTELIIFDLGGNNDDVAGHVLVDSAGFLYVAGFANSPIGNQIAVTKLNPATGSPVNAFDGDGRATYTFGGLPSGRAINVFDMTLSPATSPQGARLYLVGDIKLAATDYQGYVIGLDPATGAVVDNLAVNNPDSSHNAALHAITVLADGDIAMAGTMDTDVVDQPQLVLVKMHTQGLLDLDDGFCGSGICTKQLTGAGPNHNWTSTLPSAIAERSNTRDLVIGMQAVTWTYNFSTDTYSSSQKQVVQQYSANAMTLQASQQRDFPVAPGDGSSASSAGMLVDSASVMLTGTRLWSAGNEDFDITVTRMLANDTIFASQFGGPHSD